MSPRGHISDEDIQPIRYSNSVTDKAALIRPRGKLLWGVVLVSIGLALLIVYSGRFWQQPDRLPPSPVPVELPVAAPESLAEPTPLDRPLPPGDSLPSIAAPTDPQQPSFEDTVEIAPPKIPSHLLYRLYIERAEAGDAEAQYIVSLALTPCQGGVRTPEQLQRFMDNPRHPPASKDWIQQQFENCQPLRELLGDRHPAKERRRWLDAAVEAGYPIALLQNGMLRPRNRADQEEVKSLLARALDDAAGNTVLENQVTGLVGGYLSAYEPWRNESRSAWALIHCQRNPRCNIDSTKTLLFQHYHDHEVEDIIQTAERYRAALETHQWQDLDLDLPVYQAY